MCSFSPTVPAAARPTPSALDRSMAEQLILVDRRNRARGSADKRTVHEAGLLHRAFSICLFDQAGRMLLQRRSAVKYHSAGLWANTVCGHPRPGERTLQAAHRRLGEELGAAASLRFGFTTHYDATFPNGLVENEIVSVYFGLTPAELRPNPAEVSAVAHKSLAQLKRDVRRRPRSYAAWLQHYVINHFDLIANGAIAVLGGARTR